MEGTLRRCPLMADVDFSMAVNAGQIMTTVATLITNVVSLTVVVMVIKSDVRSLREGQLAQAGRLTKIEGSMETQTEILRQQDKHEVEISHLKLQIQNLSDQLGDRRLGAHIAAEVPRHAHRRPEV